MRPSSRGGIASADPEVLPGNINTFNLLQRRSVEKRLDDQGNNSYDWIKFPGERLGVS
jgi:hypothetical protein